ncbi:MAG: hypothetical protein KDD60_11735, partial [Bdellovibrionales bacterium]|nr:hypothetical protein [Bdellovibrionales bacterium]
MRELISLVACLFLFLIGPVCVHAQIPTPPPGYDQGPWYSPKSPEVKDGHLIIQLTPKAKKRAIRKFRKARGRNPSERQLRRQIAKEFGLRISRPIGTDNVVHATGVRN